MPGTLHSSDILRQLSTLLQLGSLWQCTYVFRRTLGFSNFTLGSSRLHVASKIEDTAAPVSTSIGTDIRLISSMAVRGLSPCSPNLRMGVSGKSSASPSVSVMPTHFVVCLPFPPPRLLACFGGGVLLATVANLRQMIVFVTIVAYGVLVWAFSLQMSWIGTSIAGGLQTHS